MELPGDLGHWINSLASRSVHAIPDHASDLGVTRLCDPGSEPISASELKDWLFDNKFDSTLNASSQSPPDNVEKPIEKTCDPVWGSSDTSHQVKQVTTTNQVGCSSPDSFCSADSTLFTSMIQAPHNVLTSNTSPLTSSPTNTSTHIHSTSSGASDISSTDDLITLQPLQPLQASESSSSEGDIGIAGGPLLHSDQLVMPVNNKSNTEEVDLDKMVRDYLYDNEVVLSPMPTARAASEMVSSIDQSSTSLSESSQVMSCRSNDEHNSGLNEGTTIIGADGSQIRISGLPTHSIAAFPHLPPDQTLPDPSTRLDTRDQLGAWSERNVTTPDSSSILESALRGTLLLSSSGSDQCSSRPTLSNSSCSYPAQQHSNISANAKRRNRDSDLKTLQLPFPVNAFQNLHQSPLHNDCPTSASTAARPSQFMFPSRKSSLATTSSDSNKVDKVYSAADTSNALFSPINPNELDPCLTHTSNAKKDGSRKRKYAKRGGGDGSELLPSRGRLLHFCPICTKGFKDKYSVNVHIRTHTGEKPFQCDMCSKCFRQKAHLAKHIQIHNSAKLLSSPATSLDNGLKR